MSGEWKFMIGDGPGRQLSLVLQSLRERGAKGGGRQPMMNSEVIPWYRIRTSNLINGSNLGV